MHRFECAFASENIQKKDMEAVVVDLLLAVAICARTYDEFLDFIANGDEFNKWVKEWSGRINKSIKSDQHFNFLHEMMLFEKYMQSSVVVPHFFQEDSKGESKVSGAHWTQSVLQILTAELGYTHSEAINMPISKALADYFKFLERNGHITLMTDDQLEALEAVKE